MDGGLSTIIIDCGFDRCSTTGAFGGAVYSACPEVMIARCCGYQCYANEGPFAGISGSNALVRTISESVFLECAPPLDGSASHGTITVRQNVPISYTSANFTREKATHGAAIASMSTIEPGTTMTGLYIGCKKSPDPPAYFHKSQQYQRYFYIKR
jgi:hypothetical protein